MKRHPGYAVIPAHAVAALPTLSATTVKLLVAVASFMSRKHPASRPSAATIREMTGIRSQNTLKKCLREASVVMHCEFRAGLTYRFTWKEPPSKFAGGTDTTPTNNCGDTPIKVCRTKYTRRNTRSHAAVSVPAALTGLSLYEADRRLCEAWDDLLSSWARAYPRVDILSEVAKAHAWEVANPQRRKKDRARFLSGWLSRCKPTLPELSLEPEPLPAAVVELLERDAAREKAKTP